MDDFRAHYDLVPVLESKLDDVTGLPELSSLHHDTGQRHVARLAVNSRLRPLDDDRKRHQVTRMGPTLCRRFFLQGRDRVIRRQSFCCIAAVRWRQHALERRHHGGAGSANDRCPVGDRRTREFWPDHNDGELLQDIGRIDAQNTFIVERRTIRLHLPPSAGTVAAHGDTGTR